MADQEAFDTGSRQDQAAQCVESDDVGDRRLAEQDRDLAEELAAPERRPLLPIDLDGASSVEDDVEGRTTETLSEDALAFGVPAFLERMGDLMELRRREVGEQCKPCARLDDLVRSRPRSAASRERAAFAGTGSSRWRPRSAIVYDDEPHDGP